MSSYLEQPGLAEVPGVLSQAPPWLFRRVLMPLLSSKVIIDEEVSGSIRRLAASSRIVYAMKYRNIYDLQFLRTRFAQLGLPEPTFVFETSASGTGSVAKFFKVWKGRLSRTFQGQFRPDRSGEDVVRQILTAGGAAVMFLVDETTSGTRYAHPETDPIRILLDLQGKLAGSISMVPLTVLYDRTPRPTIRPLWEAFLGNPDSPGPLRRILIAVRKWMVPELLMGEPVHLIGELEEFGADTPWEDLPFEIRKRLVASINESIRVNRGPEEMSHTEIKERVLEDPLVKEAVLAQVSKEGVPEHKVRKKAESYVEEIASKRNMHVIHFFFLLVKWMASKMFSGLDYKEDQFSILKKACKDRPLVFVACHKSHFDYLLIGYLCFQNQMAIPYIAAGTNLIFWPVGTMLRHGAAFFLRRTIKGLDLYPEVFAAYLRVLLKDKTSLKFYIEGGRSRTGKLLPPKVGMLSFIVRAIEDGAVEDIAFVPSFIGYDQIPEEGSYLRELAGKEKSKENVFALIRAREVLSKSFGKVYVRFNEPVSFVEFRKAWIASRDSSEDVKHQDRQLIEDFAYFLMKGIAANGVVTPVELAAGGMICSGRTEISREQFLAAEDCFGWMIKRKGCEFLEGMHSVRRTVDRSVGLFASRRFLEVIPDSSESSVPEAYIINEPKRGHLTFYKNGLLNHMWAEAAAGLVLLRERSGAVPTDAEMEEDFSLLARLLNREIIWDPLVRFDALCRETLGLFAEAGWMQRDDSGRMTIVDRGPLDHLGGLLADLVEVYHLALLTAERLADTGVSLKDFIKRLNLVRDGLAKEAGRGTTPVPSIAVDNCLNTCAEMGMLEYGNPRKTLNRVADSGKLEMVRDFLASCLAGRLSGRGVHVGTERRDS